MCQRLIASTPLLIDSQNGHVSVEKALLAVKVDVKATRATDDATPLFMASQKGLVDVVKALQFPLVIVLAQGHTTVTSLLLAKLT